MNSKLLKFCLLCLFLSSTNASAADALKIINAWIPEAPPAASVMAGYMEIENHSNKNIDIVSISSDAFASVEMHRSVESDGFAKMQPQKKFSIAANKKLILQSGSYHLMLINPTKWLRHGDKVTLDFTLANHKTQSLEIHIKKSAARTMKCATGKNANGKCGTQ